VTSPASLTASVEIDPDAEIGTRTVAVSTNGQTVALADGFQVLLKEANLAINKVAAAPAVAGTKRAIKLRISNAGPHVAKNAVARYKLAAGVSPTFALREFSTG
jgi:hypothetical protein